MDNKTTDTFGRTWITKWNQWKPQFSENRFFCMTCHQPIPTWYDEPQNRDKQVCSHKRLRTGDVIQMGGEPTRNDYLDTSDYVEALAGQEVCSSYVSGGEADMVVGCHRVDRTTLKLYCGGKVLAQRATRKQMAVLFGDMFAQEFGTGDVMAVLQAEFGL